MERAAPGSWRQITVKVVRPAFHALNSTAAAALLRTRPIESIRRRMIAMEEGDVVEIVEALEHAGVTVHLAGGWAVDAVVGSQTRRHFDLDLVLDASAEVLAQAVEALAPMGFAVESEEQLAVPWMPRRVILRDALGRFVDLHPVDLHPADASGGPSTFSPFGLQPGPVVTGCIGGRSVSCLSPAVQIGMRRGYELRPVDRRDLALLRSPSAQESARPTGRRRRQGPGTAVVVPVPQAEDLVGPWRDRFDPAAGLPAHITVLFPFLSFGEVGPMALRTLEEVAASVPAFSFRFEGVGRFPGVVYLAPEPAEPFVALTDALWARWPECPPYKGRHRAVVPHLTVAQGAEPPGLVEALAVALPVEARAEEMVLYRESATDKWSEVARFPLG